MKTSELKNLQPLIIRISLKVPNL